MKRTRTKTSKATWDFVHQEINDKGYLCFTNQELKQGRCPYYNSIRTNLREIGYLDSMDKVTKPIPKTAINEIAALQIQKIETAKARSKAKKEQEGMRTYTIPKSNPSQTKMFSDELQQVSIETLVAEIRRRGWEAKVTKQTIQEL